MNQQSTNWMDALWNVVIIIGTMQTLSFFFFWGVRGGLGFSMLILLSETKSSTVKTYAGNQICTFYIHAVDA